MGRRLIRLLEAAVAAPDSRSAACDPGAGRARHHPAAWNATAQPVPRDPAGAVRRAAARTPDAVAVVFEDRTLSYRELDARANRLAQHLRELGVGPEIVVGRVRRALARDGGGLLAILKAGGAYLPLDPAYPAERLADMLADARAAGAADAGQLPARCRCRRRACRILLEPDVGGSSATRRRATRLDERHARRSGLRDLHLGLDRPAQGRGEHARGICATGCSGCRTPTG